MMARAPGAALVFVTVGKPGRGPYLELAEDYLARIGHMAPCRHRWVRASTRRRPEERQREEAAALREHLTGRGVSVALEIGPRAPTSQALCRRLTSWRARGTVVFFIGGPDGLDASLLAECSDRLALSPLTLPHDLALIVLLEQCYRALGVERGHPYGRH